MSVRSLIVVLILSSWWPAARASDEVTVASPWRFDLGVGVDAHWRREVNPAFGEYVNAPEVFTNIWFHRFAASLEFGGEPAHRSTSGGLAITSQANRFGAWGRYGYATWGPVTPYVSLGAGASFDRIRTTFMSSVDERRGTRRFVGLGTGLSAKMLRFVVLEAEARVTSEEAVKFPGVAFVLRVGLSF